jgi:Xaa-Pro aminopeptidase
MKKPNFGQQTLLALLVLLQAGNLAYSQRTGYSKEEFLRRRAALMEKVADGLIILFGESMPQPGAHFRQDNDFYYFSGVESPGAILVMAPKTKESYLFLPQQTARETQMEGANLLQDPQAKDKTGFQEVYQSSFLDEFVSRNSSRLGLSLHLRLSPRDFVDFSRSETQIFTARKARVHYNDQLTLDNYRIQKLRERYPACEFRDIAPAIDELRMIKSSEEISIMRRNGTISAEAVKEAMIAGRPGGYEYEVEAAGMHVILKNGARGAAYPPIVGSGPNSCIFHYEKNARRIEAGDLVLMDFGADLDYLCMDITRTWPASGRFTPEQREVYEVVLAVLNACLEAYRPGVTSEDVQKHVAEVMKKKGLDARGLRGGFGHFVGLGTHDVGQWPKTLQEGMVFAIEPALYYPDKNIGIRIEDTVLISKDGCEVLTKGVPKEIDEVEQWLAQGYPIQKKSPRP